MLRCDCVNKYAIFLLFLPVLLLGRPVETFYGTFEVDEPLLLELIDSRPMQRLKRINQYGVSHFTTHKEDYTRYDHSLGVFILLRHHGRSLKEQVAGLLHDVSHTAFSHVGDWVFQKAHQEKDYQNAIHCSYLRKSGLGAILQKYGLTCEEIEPLAHLFPALEAPLPDLCADRIDYNLQGAYHQGFLTRKEAEALFYELSFDGEKWVTRRPDLMKKVAQFSYFMSRDCWGSMANHFQSTWLAEALLRAVKIELISQNDLHFGVDQRLWDQLSQSDDTVIKERMRRVHEPRKYFTFAKEGEEATVIKTKFRGIDPWIFHKGKLVRLSEFDSEIKHAYNSGKKDFAKGWRVRA